MIKTVRVTKANIADAPTDGNGAYCCPIANAIRRLVWCGVAVLKTHVIFKVGRGKKLSVTLPSDVRERIANWDDNDVMPPFCFDLDIPQEAHK